MQHCIPQTLGRSVHTAFITAGILDDTQKARKLRATGDNKIADAVA